MGGNGRRDQQTTARQTPSSSGGRQSEHVRKTPPPDGLVPPLSADEHQDATDVCAHTDNLGCGLFWHVSYAASLHGAQFCRLNFFPSYSWMMRQNVGDTASCWESALPLHCRHFRRESVSPSAYIYIYLYIYIHSSEMYTSGKQTALRKTDTAS